MLRFRDVLTFAVCIAPVPASADVVFSDSTFNLSNYTQTPVYTTAGSSIAVSQAGGGVDVTGAVNSTPSGSGLVQIGLVSNVFAYDPSTQGAIVSITASATKIQSVTPYLAQPLYQTGANVLLEQDGQYYVTHIAGPGFNGQSLGLTLSANELTASDFTLWNPSTGGYGSANPNFSGDTIRFGMFYYFGTDGNIVCSNVDSNRTFDLLTASTPPRLTASPTTLSFSSEAESSTPLQQTILVANSGAGSAAFTATVVSGSPWISVSPAAGTAVPGSPVPITVTANARALSAGGYRDVIRLTYSGASSTSSIDVPVALFAANAGPILFAGPGGALFTEVAGAGSSLTQNVIIANQGSAGSTVSWSAAPATGPGVPNGNFLSFGIPSGNVQPGNPSSLPLTLNANASNLAPGVYYELVQISAPGAQNSPQYVTAVFEVVPVAGNLLPTASPGGLLFIGAAGQNIPAQQFSINWSTPQTQAFPLSVSTGNGQNWLQVSPSNASVLAQVPAIETVSVNPSGMAAGVYTGTVGLGDGLYGSVNVTLILTAAAPTSLQEFAHGNLAHAQVTAAGCTPSSLVLIETSLSSSFTVPAGWPAQLIATMTDNCGNAVNTGAVAAQFSNGDPPLPLSAAGSAGQYLAVWQPAGATDTTIQLTGTSAPLQPASIQIAGFVTANQAPALAPNGILNNLNPQVGASLAPGTVAAAFGSGLSTSPAPVSPGVSPLPETFESTQLIVGAFAAPLYFLSNTQLNVEIPTQLEALQQYSAVSVVNGALSLPVTVGVVPMAPGVAAAADGGVIAQHSDFSLVTSSSPAHPGESVVIYLSGMGATSPPVASGAAAPGLAPGQSLASAVVQPVVKVNGQIAQIQFAGLTPGGIGLYQVNFIVPGSAPPGTLGLIVSQGSANANATTLPIAVQ